MESKQEVQRSSLRRSAFLRLLACVPLLALPTLPLHAYFARPDELTLFTWLLAIEGVLCLAGFILLGIRWPGQGGSGRKNGDKTVLTENSLFDYLGRSRVFRVARIELALSLVWTVAALISIRTEDAGVGEITVIGWIALGLSAFLLIAMILAVISALKPAKQFTLTLSRVTYTEAVERRDPGNDGTTTYDYYVYFADAAIPREKYICVGKLAYDGINAGDRFYLLIVNRHIAGRFEANAYEPDETLKTKLVDETLVSAETIREAEQKQLLESDILRSVARGTLPKQEADALHESAPDTASSDADSSARTVPDFAVRPRVVRIAVSVLAVGVLLACLMLFLRDYAYALWPATLLPLLAAVRPIRELILNKRNAGTDDGLYHISRRAYLNADLYRILNQAILWLCVFLPIWWAAYSWIAEEDASKLWGPLFLFVYPPGIAALILFIIAPLRFRKRRSRILRGEITVMELPLLRKEQKKLTDNPDCRFWFPDIARSHDLFITNNCRAVFEKGRLKVDVSPAEFRSAREGDLFTFVFRDYRQIAGELSVEGMYRSSTCVVDDDMANCIRSFDPSLMYEDDRLYR